VIARRPSSAFCARSAWKKPKDTGLFEADKKTISQEKDAAETWFQENDPEQ
jgi:hypothetical protein